ncbi:hypothetical protein [Tumebacillus permanentifrigoris]|uniref:Uncharacterized protein n=1 Tax=Tumebacillus permanentifrigoris TaxID=378543 RepID=A0A316D3V4_9BACL|nr:hypothetical protein [Tumebacillus permanentifrigoris]PWK06622.1 hypothetical protein C7459_11945 [Tumebacillus permanentifrigoris]
METHSKIGQAINYLQAKGFLVKGYGYPESESHHSGESIADQYRVLQGDYDTGMIAPMELMQVVEQLQQE